ncbi:MAG: hypothetical protein SGPRY_014570, partial [Prymnesium sp.]
EEQIITDRLTNIKENARAMHACEWHNSRMRSDVLTSHQKATKMISAELDQQNKELLLLRRARMREFLADEAKEYDPAPSFLPVSRPAQQHVLLLASCFNHCPPART